MDENIPTPGSGKTATVSVSLHEGTIAAVRDAVGKRGFSAFLEEAATRAVYRARLAEWLDQYQAEHGEFIEAELADADALLFGTDASGSRPSEAA